MGDRIQTLEDLLRPGLHAICVGINPSPVSVEAGHYYQGRLGQQFFRRLRYVGLLEAVDGDFEDDAAFRSGVGFTDIVKRPTANAAALSPVEFEHGRSKLEEKLRTHSPELVIFTFKKAAESLFGLFLGNGFDPGLRIEHSEVFVMPGPYESNTTVFQTLDRLAERLS
jgi:double-stranded uracil-DNA glycosylase